MANQFVVQLPNEPGAMATLAEALAARGVDLRAIGGGSIGDSGHVIMTTNEDAETKAVLEAGGYTFVEGESLLVEVDDRPGGMARLARELADADVNILGPPVHRPVGRSRHLRLRRRQARRRPPDHGAQGLGRARDRGCHPDLRPVSSGGSGLCSGPSCSMGAPVSAPVHHRFDPDQPPRPDRAPPQSGRASSGATPSCPSIPLG